jgi:DNA topoisomerase III
LPELRGVVKENYRRYACAGADGRSDGCGFSFGKSPGGRTFEIDEAEAFLRDRHIGPLEGFRSKAGWPFVAELALKFSEEDKNWKLEFDFGDDKADEDTGELVDFSTAEALGPCPKCGSPVHAHGSNYVCSHSVPTAAQPTPSCDFKSGTTILQQEVAPEQMRKLLSTGKTDLLDKFVSNKTRRAFKAFLAWDPGAGKVAFEFEPRESKYPPRKTAARPATKAASKTAAKKAPAKKAARKTAG